MFTKDNEEKKNNILIEIGKYYPDNCSMQKVTQVSRELYEFLEAEERKSESAARHDRRYLASFSFDEERDGFNQNSAEEVLFNDKSEMIKQAFEKLSEYEQLIITLKYFQNKNYLQISAEMGVSKSALYRHLEKAKKKLSSMLVDLM